MNVSVYATAGSPISVLPIIRAGIGLPTLPAAPSALEIMSLYELKLTKEELLLKDDNVTTFLEHILKKDISLYDIKEIIKNDIDIAKIVCECNAGLYVFDFNEETLFSEINGILFIDYLFSHNKFIYTFMSNIKEKTEIIDLLVEYKKEYMLRELTKEIIEKLISKNNEGNYLIEKYLNNHRVLKEVIPLINDINILMDICEKNNTPMIII